jgi:hypothetical protein
MKSTPPRALLKTSSVFWAVWPTYCPTRSARETSTIWPVDRIPIALSNWP